MDPQANAEVTESEGSTSGETHGKRKATPFTSTMDVALATAYTTEKNILDGTIRAHGVPNRQQKLTAWERIRDCVNAFSGDSNLKSVQQCKDRHRNLIQAVRFRRNTGMMEGPMPIMNNEMLEMIDTTADLKDKTTTEDHIEQTDTAPEPANGIPSTSMSPKDKKMMKRRSSSPTGTTEEYRKRKLTIMIKEHIVRVELMKVQTEYYKTKTEFLRQTCTHPTSLLQKIPTPNVSKNILPPNLLPKLPGNT